MSRRFLLVCAVRFLAIGLLGLPPSRVEACTLSAYPLSRGKRIYFTGVARADTVLAGRGKVSYESSAWRKEPIDSSRPPVIYGQVVTVKRLMAGVSHRVQRAIERWQGNVILVPWSVRSDCKTILWSKGAQWVPVDSGGMFAGRLRDPKDWIHGQPTMDVFVAYHNPWPLRDRDRGWPLGWPSRKPRERLTAEEMLEFVGNLPEEYPVRSEVDLRPLHLWVARHAELAFHYPAYEIVYILENANARARVEGIKSPIAGTYRMTLRFRDGDSLTMFVRTQRRPNQEEETLTAKTPPSDEHPRRFVGYYLLSQVALHREELTTTASKLPASFQEQAFLGVSIDSAAGGRHVMTWLGGAYLLKALAVSGPDSSMKATLLDIDQIEHQRLSDGSRSNFPGTFTRHAHGKMTFDEVIEKDGIRHLTIHGERLDTLVVGDN